MANQLNLYILVFISIFLSTKKSTSNTSQKSCHSQIHSLICLLYASIHPFTHIVYLVQWWRRFPVGSSLSFAVNSVSFINNVWATACPVCFNPAPTLFVHWILLLNEVTYKVTGRQEIFAKEWRHGLIKSERKVKLGWQLCNRISIFMLFFM